MLESQGIYGGKCLDLCCGNGEFSQVLRDRHGMTVTCADYIPDHLLHAEELGFATVTIDIDSNAKQIDDIASKYKGQFDLVVSLAAIEHVFNSDNMLRFAHTVLKPGGRLLVNTPNIGFVAYRILSLCAGNRPFGEGHHIRFWDFRFLRTNLYLNGFSIEKDGRKFFSLPQDAMLRAFRNHNSIASVVSWLFHGCQVMQYIPMFKGLCCDELTVVAIKDDVSAIGFELNNVKHFFENIGDSIQTKKTAINRLKTARNRGWLDEHIYLSKFVDTL